MSNGESHAKQIVIGQATELARKLKNGSGGDSQVQGQAIGLVIEMITPMYEAEFMTLQKCTEVRELCSVHQKESHKKIIEKIESLAVLGDRKDDIREDVREQKELEKEKKGSASLKLGPLELKGSVVPIFIILGVLLVPTAALLFILGKLQSWF